MSDGEARRFAFADTGKKKAEEESGERDLEALRTLSTRLKTLSGEVNNAGRNAQYNEGKPDFTRVGLEQLDATLEQLQALRSKVSEAHEAKNAAIEDRQRRYDEYAATEQGKIVVACREALRNSKLENQLQSLSPKSSARDFEGYDEYRVSVHIPDVEDLDEEDFVPNEVCEVSVNGLSTYGDGDFDYGWRASALTITINESGQLVREWSDPEDVDEEFRGAVEAKILELINS